MEHELTDSQNKVLQEIGRNLLLYQHLEGQLKLLLFYADISGDLTPDTTKLRNAIEARIETFQKQTMGQLSRSYLRELFFDEAEKVPTGVFDASAALSEVQVSINIGFIADTGLLDGKMQVFADLVAERNNLAHHFLTKHDISSLEGCHIALAELKEQHCRALQILDELNSSVSILKEALQLIMQFLQSDEGERFLEEVRSSNEG